MTQYRHLAAQQAFAAHGKDYADYIERHTNELIAKGHDMAGRSLGESLMGNEGI